MTKIKGYPLLNSVAVLYFIVIVFVLNLGVFIYIKDNQSIFLIACSAIIVYLFNHNMIVVLLLSMLIVNSLIFINKLMGKKEGLDNPTESSTPVVEKTEPAPDQGGELTTIKDSNTICTELVKKINIAIAGIKNSSDKLQKLDPALDIDLKDINTKLNELYTIAN
jgi:hypothetical protein